MKLFFLLPVFLTLPPSPPLKHKGRSETTVFHRVTPFPLTLRGRVGVRVQRLKQLNMSPLRQSPRKLNASS